MNYTLRIQLEAESDLREANRWYQERRDGLEAEFIATVEACLTSIQSRPLAFPMVFDKVRRALLRRFPYGIFFVMEQDIVTVLACFHAKRDPGQIQRRLYATCRP